MILLELNANVTRTGRSKSDGKAKTFCVWWRCSLTQVENQSLCVYQISNWSVSLWLRYNYFLYLKTNGRHIGRRDSRIKHFWRGTMPPGNRGDKVTEWGGEWGYNTRRELPQQDPGRSPGRKRIWELSESHWWQSFSVFWSACFTN